MTRPTLALATLIAVALSVGLLAQATGWKALASWSGGSNTKETESFTTTQREWRVRWTLKPTGDVSALTAFVKRAEDDRLVSTFSAGEGEKAGESYVRGIGKFYLTITSINANWTIAAEEPAK